MEYLTQSRKRFIILSSFHIFIFVVILISFWNFSRQNCQRRSNPAPVFELSELLKPGDVGELMVKNEETGKEESLVTSIMPLTIFNTTGKIRKVGNDSIIVYGDGFNFADQQPRNLTIIISDSTLTFIENQTKRYEGLIALEYLKEGMEILVDSDFNIRGKTEFYAKTINVL